LNFQHCKGIYLFLNTKSISFYFYHKSKIFFFGRFQSYFPGIFYLSYFYTPDVNLSIRQRKARYGAKNGQNEKSRGKPG
jgi:hypothetical protein